MRRASCCGNGSTSASSCVITPNHTTRCPPDLETFSAAHGAAAIHAKSNQVESLVEDRFDSLPFSLRVSHDEQRGRLDLYCAMTLVFVVVGMVSAVQFILEHDNDGGWHGWKIGGAWEYGVWLAFVCMVSALVQLPCGSRQRALLRLAIAADRKVPRPDLSTSAHDGEPPTPCGCFGRRSR